MTTRTPMNQTTPINGGRIATPTNIIPTPSTYSTPMNQTFQQSLRNDQPQPTPQSTMQRPSNILPTTRPRPVDYSLDTTLPSGLNKHLQPSAHYHARSRGVMNSAAVTPNSKSFTSDLNATISNNVPLLPPARVTDTTASMLQTLTRDLVAEQRLNSVPRGQVDPATQPILPATQAREFLSSSTMHKLQTILATSWLADDKAVARTEELLLSARYYSTWREAGDVASRPEFQQLHAQLTAQIQENMQQWTSLLSEGLFITVAPASIAVPSANNGVFGTPHSQSSTTCMRFGSRVVFAFMDGPKMFVRVGGGFVEALEYAKNYSAVEGRKAAALLARDELICLSLLLQERLFSSVIKRYQQRQEYEAKLQSFKDDATQINTLSTHFHTFESRMAEQLLQAKIKLSKQKLHWKWTREQRIQEFANEAQAKHALQLEEQQAEEMVRRIETMTSEQQKQAKSIEAAKESDSRDSFVGPVETLATSISHSILPLSLASFMDDLGSSIANLSDAHVESQTLLQASQQNERRLQDEVTALRKELEMKDVTLHDAQSTVLQLLSRLISSETALKQQNDAWTLKLTTILAELKTKTTKEQAEKKRFQEETQEEIAQLQSQVTTSKQQVDLLSAQLEDEEKQHESIMQELTAKLKKLDDENATLHTTVTTARAELQSATKIIETLNPQVRDMNAMQSEMDDLIRRHERITRDMEMEIESLRRHERELEEKLHQEHIARHDEQLKWKKEIVEAWKGASSMSTSLNSSPSKLQGGATNIPTSRFDPTFDLSIDDIITELPQSQQNSTFSSPHTSPRQSYSSLSSTSAATGVPSSTSPYVPLTLFNRLHHKYRYLGEQYTLLLSLQQKDQIKLQQYSEAEFKNDQLIDQYQIGFETKRNEMQELERLMKEKDAYFQQQTEQHQQTMETLKSQTEQQLTALQQQHQLALNSFKSTSEAKINEINQIYSQMLGLKDQVISDLNAERDELEKQLQQAQDIINKAHQDAHVDRASLQKSHGSLQQERDQLQQVNERLRRTMKAMKPFFHQTQSELHALKSVHKQLREDFEHMRVSTMNVDLIRSTMQTQVSKHVALMDEYIRRYKYELSLRRKYFDKLSELQGNIRVYVRVRPTLPSVATTTDLPELPNGLDPLSQAVFSNPLDDPCALTLSYSPTGSKLTPTPIQFEFDRVFTPSDTQDIVFKEIAHLVTSFMDGFNVCVFAYGQTGSGKTHTMTGEEDDVGVIYRALQELFRLRAERAHGFSYTVSVSHLEIYNDTIRDLLAPPHLQLREHKIQDTGAGVTIVPALVELPCADEQAILNAIALGQRSRATSMTMSNSVSSRSHSIVILNITAQDLHSDKKFSSKMQLIDLAGSERLKKSQSVGERLLEAKAINKSLSSLGNVLQGLQLGQQHIPFRDCKLTHLLKDSLGGPSKALMIVTVTPDAKDVPETYCSLQFGLRARKVELINTPAQTPSASPSSSNSDRYSAHFQQTPTGGKRRSQSIIVPGSGNRSSQFPDGSEGLDSNSALAMRGAFSVDAQQLKVAQAANQDLQRKLQLSETQEQELLKQIHQLRAQLQQQEIELDKWANESAEHSGSHVKQLISQFSRPNKISPKPHLARSSSIGSFPIVSADAAEALSPTSTATPTEISYLTSTISALKLDLLAKSRLEDELKQARAQLAEKEMQWQLKQQKWKETEARRKATEALAAKNKMNQTKDEVVAVQEVKVDVYHPESVVVARLTSDVKQLEHELRIKTKQYTVLSKYLADHDLPSIEQLWKDRGHVTSSKPPVESKTSEGMVALEPASPRTPTEGVSPTRSDTSSVTSPTAGRKRSGSLPKPIRYDSPPKDPPPPRKPRVPILSKSFPKLANSVLSSPPPPKPTKIPRSASKPTPTAPAASLIQTEPIILKRKAPVPIQTSETSSLSTPLTAPTVTDASLDVNSPTRASIAQGLELSQRILSSPEHNRSASVDSVGIPTLRGGGKKKEVVEESPPVASPSPIVDSSSSPPTVTDTVTPIKKPSSSPFAGINFGQIAAEASAAVYSASPTAAPFRTMASSPTPVASPLPAASPLSPTSPKFVGEPVIAAAVQQFKSISNSEGIPYIILSSRAATTIELGGLGEPAVTNKKVLVYAKGDDALTERWNKMFLTPDSAYYLLLLIKEGFDASSLSRFVVIEWIGSETDAATVSEIQSFSPVLQSFLSKQFTISLYSQASHPSQVTHQAILIDLAKNRRRSGKSASADSDEEGEFVDLNAQLAAEQQQASASPTEPVAEEAPATTGRRVRATPMKWGGTSSSKPIAQSPEAEQPQSSPSPETQTTASNSAATIDVDESDIVTAEQVEAEARSRRVRATPRKWTGTSSTVKSTTPAKQPAAPVTPPRKPPVPLNPRRVAEMATNVVPEVIFSQSASSPLVKGVLKAAGTPSRKRSVSWGERLEEAQEHQPHQEEEEEEEDEHEGTTEVANDEEESEQPVADGEEQPDGEQMIQSPQYDQVL